MGDAVRDGRQLMNALPPSLRPFQTCGRLLWYDAREDAYLGHACKVAGNPEDSGLTGNLPASTFWLGQRTGDEPL